MAEMFGHAWVSQYGDDAGGSAGDTWAACLEGLNGAQVAIGFRALRDSARDWPPSAPAFRAMCFGIPTLAMVKLDLRQETRDRMPFTRLVWELLDGYRFTRCEQREADRMLTDAYELAQTHVLGGGSLPESVPLFGPSETPELSPAKPEVAQAALAAIADMLGVGSEESSDIARSDESTRIARAGATCDEE